MEKPPQPAPKAQEQNILVRAWDEGTVARFPENLISAAMGWHRGGVNCGDSFLTRPPSTPGVTRLRPSYFPTPGRWHPPPKGAQVTPWVPTRPLCPPGTRPPWPEENAGPASSPSPAPRAAFPPHTQPALGSGGPLHTQPRLGAVSGISHYLPQADVTCDGQSERQCNVLHGLSHGSVQNPANTEVPPTAASPSNWSRAPPATAAGQGHDAPAAETKTRFPNGRPPASGPFLLSFLFSSKTHFPRLGSCKDSWEREGRLVTTGVEDLESLNESLNGSERRGRMRKGDLKSQNLSRKMGSWGRVFRLKI